MCGVGCGNRKFGQSEVCYEKMSGREHGQQYVGCKFSAGKRKFGQGEVYGKQQQGPSNCSEGIIQPWVHPDPDFVFCIYC